MARIDDVTVTTIAPNGEPGFAIVDSRRHPGEQRRTLVPPSQSLADTLWLQGFFVGFLRVNRRHARVLLPQRFRRHGTNAQKT